MIIFQKLVMEPYHRKSVNENHFRGQRQRSILEVTSIHTSFPFVSLEASVLGQPNLYCTGGKGKLRYTRESWTEVKIFSRAR